MRVAPMQFDRPCAKDGYLGKPLRRLLTASFMDYAMRPACDLPSLRTAFIATPAPSNPLGVKGGSESGTIGAPAAIGNAVIDALWHLGVRDITLPITSETVWRAIRHARTRA